MCTIMHTNTHTHTHTHTHIHTHNIYIVYVHMYVYICTKEQIHTLADKIFITSFGSHKKHQFIHTHYILYTKTHITDVKTKM